MSRYKNLISNPKRRRKLAFGKESKQAFYISDLAISGSIRPILTLAYIQFRYFCNSNRRIFHCKTPKAIFIKIIYGFICVLPDRSFTNIFLLVFTCPVCSRGCNTYLFPYNLMERTLLLLANTYLPFSNSIIYRQKEIEKTNS